MLLPIIGLATSLLPSLARLLIGDTAGAAAETIITAAKEIFGTTDTAAIESKIAADPALKDQFIARLQADTEELRLRLADTQNARAQTVELARAGSSIAWGAPIVSLIIVTGFIGVMVTWMFFPPTGNAAALAVLNNLVGFLGFGFSSVCNYWLGSSASSAAKDASMRSALVPLSLANLVPAKK